MKKEKAALVLSGGGALGAIELGIISVLEKHYSFDFFAGTSIGSLIATFLAEGKTAKEILEVFSAENMKNILIDFSVKGFGMVNGEKFLNFLEQNYKNKTFTDFETSMTFVATNFKSGERVNISNGSVAEAVRASCGIPIMFKPYWHTTQKKWLVDGGLCQNFPLDIALKQYKGKKIIAINVGTFIDESLDFSDSKKKINLTSIVPLMIRTVRIMMRNQHFETKDNRVELFEPMVGDFSFLNFKQKRFEEMFAFGVAFAEQQLLKNKK